MTVLERAAQEFADAESHPPFASQLPIEEGRAGFVKLQSGAVPRPAADVSDLDVPAGEWGRVGVRILRPCNTTGLLPVILYLHAGWAFGDTTTHDRLMREFADGARAAVVFPSFSRSPEAKYPTAINEIYAVAEWIRDQGANHGLDASRIAIAGDSAGGNMATVVALMSKQRGGPSFKHQLLFYPTLDADFDKPSYLEFATGFHVRRDHAQWLWDLYLPERDRRSEILASPLLATTSELADLPPATVIVPEADVMRDDGEAYANNLRTAGVPVTAVRYQGTIHDFVVLDALRETCAARAATAQAIDTFRSALGTDHGSNGWKGELGTGTVRPTVGDRPAALA